MHQPKLDVLLVPVFDGDDAISLAVELKIDAQLDDGKEIFSAALNVASIDTTIIEEGSLQASDKEGPLELKCADDTLARAAITRRWRATRATVGVITVSYTALPRSVDRRTKNGPALDFRNDRGGLLGSGYGFLVIPPDCESDYEINLHWDLNNAPSGTKAVWTYAEGAQGDTKIMSPSSLQHTYFAVGQLNSIQVNEHAAGSSSFGMYWFGETPFDVHDAARRMKTTFRYMSTFFGDENDVYRIFLRHNPHRGTNTGTALRRSFMFGYDDSEYTNPSPPGIRLSVLSHEMVHNWVLFDGNHALHDNWYSEGMAEYYSLVLRHRAGTLSNADFLKDVNSKLTGYYTNPVVGLSNVEVGKLTWKISDAQRLPYGRGFAFGVQINDCIIKATNEHRSIDDLVLQILACSRRGEEHGVEEYLDSLGRDIGRDVAQRLYDEMSSGKLLIPAEDSLVSFLPVKLIRQDQERWELGFDETTSLIGDKIVDGLLPGSRAALSGLENGDKLVNGINMNDAKSDFSLKLSLEVERNSELRRIEYWPRSWEKVESYQYVELEGPGTR